MSGSPYESVPQSYPSQQGHQAVPDQSVQQGVGGYQTGSANTANYQTSPQPQNNPQSNNGYTHLRGNSNSYGHSVRPSNLSQQGSPRKYIDRSRNRPAREPEPSPSPQRLDQSILEEIDLQPSFCSKHWWVFVIVIAVILAAVAGLLLSGIVDKYLGLGKGRSESTQKVSAKVDTNLESASSSTKIGTTKPSELPSTPHAQSTTATEGVNTRKSQITTKEVDNSHSVEKDQTNKSSTSEESLSVSNQNSVSKVEPKADKASSKATASSQASGNSKTVKQKAKVTIEQPETVSKPTVKEQVQQQEPKEASHHDSSLTVKEEEKEAAELAEAVGILESSLNRDFHNDQNLTLKEKEKAAAEAAEAIEIMESHLSRDSNQTEE